MATLYRMEQPSPKKTTNCQFFFCRCEPLVMTIYHMWANICWKHPVGFEWQGCNYVTERTRETRASDRATLPPFSSSRFRESIFKSPLSFFLFLKKDLFCYGYNPFFYCCYISNIIISPKRIPFLTQLKH